VEGEKCVEALWELGIVAVTSAGGAGSGKHTDWTPLAGRDVVLWPDNDAEPFKGQKHMEEVGNLLAGLNPVPHVRMVEIKALDIPIKGDAVEFLARLHEKTNTEKRSAILAVMQDAVSISAVRDLLELIEDAISGRRKAIDLPWRGINEMALALLPSNIVILCGAPGCGKSFALLEVAHFLFCSDVSVAIYMLEEDTSYHLNRLWAQLEGNPNLLNPQWMKDHPEETRAAKDRHIRQLESFATVIESAPNKQPTLNDLLKWTEIKANAGCRVIIVDPISVAKMGREPWNEATEFMVSAKKLMRESAASMIVSAHPKKGAQANGLVDLDSVAGGAGFTRLAQTVFWLEMHSDFHTSNIQGSYGIIESCTHNRTMHVLKARNAAGQGQKVALQFDRRKLVFTELGIVVDKKVQPKQRDQYADVGASSDHADYAAATFSEEDDLI
jgi:DNA polymerase III delta prime subunit